MKRRHLLFLGIPVVLVALFVTGALIFQDNIGRFLINPRTPFQAMEPPEKPDYITPEAWLLWPEIKTERPEETGPVEDANTPATQTTIEETLKAADIFYIHGTTYDRPDVWNAPIDDKIASTALQDIALPNEIGPFAEIGQIFAPRYRQATLFSRFTHKYDSIAARTLAYEDVREAFKHYLTIADRDRPLVIVGYDQGGLYAAGLVQEFIVDDQRLKDRLAAVYVIRYGVPMNVFAGGLSSVQPCLHLEQAGCFVSYNPFESKFKKEIENTRERTLVFNERHQLSSVTDERMLCVNPLSWRTDENYVSSEKHIGSASATGLMLDQTPPLVKNALGVKCENGVLALDEPPKSFLKRKRWFGEQWRAQPFNLFYADLREDVKRRIDRHAPVLAARYRQLDPLPIEDAVELTDSPINKVPR